MLNTDVLLDVLKHTLALGNLEILKVTGSADETKLESMAPDNSVVFKAFLKNPIKEFEGEFGMSQLSVLKGFTEFPPFRTDGATISVKRETKNGKETTTEIIFKDVNSRPANYRLVSAELVPLQPKPMASAWDIVVTPTKSKIQELTKAAQILSAQEEFFYVKNVDGDLRFYIGEPESSSHKIYVSFNQNTAGTLNGLYWSMPQILTILKLIDENVSFSEMSILSKFLLQIKLITEHCEYFFLCPTKKR